MKRVKVSNNVIRRLPRYLRKLDELQENGINRISSFELGQQLGLTPSQIRQDFSCFGEFGQQGYGYNVSGLREQIASILGMDRGYRAILVGVGNIGHALMDNFSFADCGVELAAAFDIKESLIGTEFKGVPILAEAEMENFTNMELTEPNSPIIVENVHFSDSLLSLSYFVSERMDEHTAEASRNEK